METVILGIDIIDNANVFEYFVYTVLIVAVQTTIFRVRNGTNRRPLNQCN
jgi:hypothetical protein